MWILFHVLFYSDFMQMKMYKFACFYIENSLISLSRAQK